MNENRFKKFHLATMETRRLRGDLKRSGDEYVDVIEKLFELTDVPESAR
jgi:hypothetical protein